MAETKTTTAKRQTRARTTAARRPTGARATARKAAPKSTATARRQAAATRRSTAAKKGVATRNVHQVEDRLEVKTAVEHAQEIAERAVLIPVGAALEARDLVEKTLDELTTTYSSRESAEKQLRRFERRGATARRRVERQAKKARTRVEREVRRRRTRVEREAKRVRRDLDKRARNVGANADLVQARVGNVVQTGVTASTKAVREASTRAATTA